MYIRLRGASGRFSLQIFVAGWIFGITTNKKQLRGTRFVPLFCLGKISKVENLWFSSKNFRFLFVISVFLLRCTLVHLSVERAKTSPQNSFAGWNIWVKTKSETKRVVCRVRTTLFIRKIFLGKFFLPRSKLLLPPTPCENFVAFSTSAKRITAVS